MRFASSCPQAKKKKKKKNTRHCFFPRLPFLPPCAARVCLSVRGIRSIAVRYVRGWPAGPPRERERGQPERQGKKSRKKNKTNKPAEIKTRYRTWIWLLHAAHHKVRAARWQGERCACESRRRGWCLCCLKFIAAARDAARASWGRVLCQKRQNRGGGQQSDHGERRGGGGVRGLAARDRGCRRGRGVERGANSFRSRVIRTERKARRRGSTYECLRGREVNN